MDRKRKDNFSGEDIDKKDFYIMLAIALAVGALLSFQTMEESNFFKPVDAPEGFVSWEKLAATKEVEVCTEDEDFLDNCEIKPEYDEGVLALDGKEVKLTGYMFPLMQGENQKEFLLGPYPQSCPFHYHVGPSQVVEVHAPEGIKFSYEPVKIEGKFSAEYNSEFGVFYYLKDTVVDK